MLLLTVGFDSEMTDGWAMLDQPCSICCRWRFCNPDTYHWDSYIPVTVRALAAGCGTHISVL